MRVFFKEKRLTVQGCPLSLFMSPQAKVKSDEQLVLQVLIEMGYDWCPWK